jgi:hypothetical protein
MASVRRTVGAEPGIVRSGPPAQWHSRRAAEQGKIRRSTARVKGGVNRGKTLKFSSFRSYLSAHKSLVHAAPCLAGGKSNRTPLLRLPDIPPSGAPDRLVPLRHPPQKSRIVPRSHPEGVPPSDRSSPHPVCGSATVIVRIHPYNQPCTPGSPSVRQPCAPYLSCCPVCPPRLPKSSAGLPA